MPHLRGHHLICLRFFSGEGYDESFIHNLNKIRHSTEDEDTIISSGADDVCRSCSFLKDGKCMYDDNADEEIRVMDSKALMLLGLSPGDKVKWAELKGRVYKIFSQWHSLYCKECDWQSACEKKVSFKRLLKIRKSVII
jgi:hypothetical protein